MDKIYLQCDSRYNQWLLRNIDDKTVIEHTLDRAKKVGEGKKNSLIAGIFDCPENTELINVLGKYDVDIRITSEEDVNKRFLNIVSTEESGYIVRIGGDQCLLDYGNITSIVREMRRNEYEWFYNPVSTCILPDIVSVDLIKRYKKELEKGNRYFDILECKKGIKRYVLPYPVLVMFSFRANSNEGFRVCRQVIRNKLDVYKLSERIQFSLINSSYLRDSGLLGSWILPTECMEFYYDEDGNINPWWGKSIIDFIKKRLNKSMIVFEWGCGNSTIFWSNNVKEVVSIENNRKWYDRMCNIVPDNVKLSFCELEYGGEYCKAILQEKRLFDIVLVDGRDRVRCIRNSIERLKNDGILILDNSERERYIEGDIFLRKQGFKKIEISSLAYGLPGREDFTAIYYRNDNIFGL